jgi:hypothetical protein
MAKALASRHTVAGRFSEKGSTNRDLDTFRTRAEALKNDPVQRRAITTKAGILTPTGQLKKAYKKA